MKICVVLPSLMVGGTEILHINLIKNWLSKGYKIHLVVVLNLDDNCSIEELVPDDCNITFLDCNNFRSSIYPLTRYMFKNRFDITLAAMWPLTVITILASRLSFNKSKIFVSEHTILSGYIPKGFSFKKLLINITSSIFYLFAHGVIAVSNAVLNDIAKLALIDKRRIKVIHNPATLNKPKPSVNDINRYKVSLWRRDVSNRLLAVGSLKTEKGFDSLLKAVNLLPASFKERSQLIILGEGSERTNLQQYINQQKLNNCISLAGFKIDPVPWFYSADLFILSSRFEGFGNVIVEALDAGLPVISTNCIGGPSEILQEGMYGELVPVDDPETLSQSILEMTNKKHDKEILIKRAQDFSLERISNKYVNYFRTS